MIKLVVAMDESNGIGKDLWMPWSLPEDLKHFQKLTLNHKILMGKTTFQTLKSPLKNRYTYVATRDRNWICDFKEVEVIYDVENFLKSFIHNEEILFVCGGASIYQQALPYCEELWITHVKGVYDVDTYFPQLDYENYEIVTQQEYSKFTIVQYRKK